MDNLEPITGEMMLLEKLIIIPPEGGPLAPPGPDNSPKSGQNGSRRPAVGSDYLSGMGLVCLSYIETVNIAAKSVLNPGQTSVTSYLSTSTDASTFSTFRRPNKTPKYPVGSCADVEIIC